MAEKLVRWFIFSVLIALLPIVFAYWHIATDGKHPNWASIVAHGELMLVSVALAADAIGELIGRGAAKPLKKILAGGGCTITVISASFYFADVSSKPPVDLELVLRTSLGIFLLTVIASASCKALAEA